MLFNSLAFAFFLPIVLILYWLASKRNIKIQNCLLLVASYIFYGWWDWRFLSLIFISSIVDYSIGSLLSKAKETNTRRILLTVSIAINLGLLGFFKYYGFFVSSFVSAFSEIGVNISPHTLKIILPVGISFYTFQTMSYTIDIYRRKINPTSDIIAFFSFVSFFPQLVAGPIERAAHLLPQFLAPRRLTLPDFSDGLKQMLWGFFLKIVIADRLSLYITAVFGNIAQHTGLTIIVATIFFSFQIYCDFAGYSLIAIGTAKLFGFDLIQNFHRPYLSSSFKEFWTRWHISLSNWFRDYVYISLGGNRKSKGITNRNILVTFILSGLWHGANWTFMIWGFLHGIMLTIEKQVSFIKVRNSGLVLFFRIILVYMLTTLTWIFFRANNLKDAFIAFSKIFHPELHLFTGDKGIFSYCVFGILILIISEIIAEYFPKSRPMRHKSLIVRALSISITISYILALGVFDESQFIYFQF
jgi:D-alanyl-lipoteichoic acid acyltransferase DltB (MBOAT superfamily)